MRKQHSWEDRPKPKQRTVGAFAYNFVAITALLVACIAGLAALAVNFASETIESTYERVIESMTRVRDDQFNAFATKQIASLESRRFDTPEEVGSFLSSAEGSEFWIVSDPVGAVLLSSGDDASAFATSFAAIARDCAGKVEPISTCEATTVEQLRAYNAYLSQQATFASYTGPEGDTPALVKIVCVPLLDQQGTCWGSAIVGRLCNNDPDAFAQLGSLAPDFRAALSSSDGIRLTGNFTHQIQNGSSQSRQVIEAISSGKRSFVDTRVNPIPLEYAVPVICDPVRNYRGEIIGGFTFGYIDSPQFETRSVTQLLFALFAAAILALGVSLAWRISQRLVTPIGEISKKAETIAEKSFLSEQDAQIIRTSSQRKGIGIREQEVLRASVATMTDSLYRQQQALQARMETIEDTNARLESLVDERTSALRRAMEKARHSSTLKSQLVLNISHDIKNPLNAAIGFSDLLLEECCGPLNPQQKDYVQIIKTSSGDVLNIFGQLLDLSALEQGKMQLAIEPVDVGDILGKIAKQEEARLERNQIELHCHIPDSLPKIEADSRCLTRVFSNILDNAIKFVGICNIPRVIEIKATARDDGVSVSIKDNGIGIEEDKLSYIFEEFYQIEDSYSEKRVGLGLGLSAVMRLVKLHHGHISADSIPGEYTCIEVTLPAHACAQGEETHE